MKAALRDLVAIGFRVLRQMLCDDMANRVPRKIALMASHTLEIHEHFNMGGCELHPEPLFPDGRKARSNTRFRDSRCNRDGLAPDSRQPLQRRLSEAGSALAARDSPSARVSNLESSVGLAIDPVDDVGERVIDFRNRGKCVFAMDELKYPHNEFFGIHD